MTLPRLHPDDLKELSDNVSLNITQKLEELISKKQLMSNLQTLTVEDVAKLLNKDKTTILRYIKKGLIEATKKGKDWIITQQSLIKYTDGK
ncbi:helix-turn-helix domain-containing protein [Flavobacterium sp.]|uniref:helix-turn-helix domain-containing protein n=1 Tax=Flavobacterium sp. TaxID=239 RepID=UPI0037519C47